MTEGSVKLEDSSFKKSQSEEQRKKATCQISKARFQKKWRERAEEIMAKSFSYLLRKHKFTNWRNSANLKQD